MVWSGLLHFKWHKIHCAWLTLKSNRVGCHNCVICREKKKSWAASKLIMTWRQSSATTLLPTYPGCAHRRLTMAPIMSALTKSCQLKNSASCRYLSKSRREWNKVMKFRVCRELDINDFCFLVHVIKFSRLKFLLGDNHSDKEVISGLIRAADLIKGNWVLKSSILYDKEYTSTRGVSADRLGSARDKIVTKQWLVHWNGFSNVNFSLQLLSFLTQDSLACKKLAKVTKIPAEDVIEILVKMAYKVSKIGWKFKLDEDSQFIKR